MSTTDLKYDEPELDMNPPPITEVVAEYKDFKENQKQTKQVEIPIPPYKTNIFIPILVDLAFYTMNAVLATLLVFIVMNIFIISNVITFSVGFIPLFIGVLSYKFLVAFSGAFFFDTRPAQQFIPDQIKSSVIHIIIFAITYGLLYFFS